MMTTPSRRSRVPPTFIRVSWHPGLLHPQVCTQRAPALCRHPPRCWRAVASKAHSLCPGSSHPYGGNSSDLGEHAVWEGEALQTLMEPGGGGEWFPRMCGFPGGCNQAEDTGRTRTWVGGGFESWRDRDRPVALQAASKAAS